MQVHNVALVASLYIALILCMIQGVSGKRIRRHKPKRGIWKRYDKYYEGRMKHYLEEELQEDAGVMLMFHKETCHCRKCNSQYHHRSENNSSKVIWPKSWDSGCLVKLAESPRQPEMQDDGKLILPYRFLRPLEHIARSAGRRDLLAPMTIKESKDFYDKGEMSTDLFMAYVAVAGKVGFHLWNESFFMPWRGEGGWRFTIKLVDLQDISRDVEEAGEGKIWNGDDDERGEAEDGMNARSADDSDSIEGYNNAASDSEDEGEGEANLKFINQVEELFPSGSASIIPASEESIYYPSLDTMSSSSSYYGINYYYNYKRTTLYTGVSRVVEEEKFIVQETVEKEEEGKSHDIIQKVEEGEPRWRRAIRLSLILGVTAFIVVTAIGSFMVICSLC